MEETISLKDIYTTLRKRLVLIIVITVLCAAGAWAYSSYLVTPMYSSSAQLLVNHTDTDFESLSSGDIRTNRDLIDTYSVVLVSPRILEPVKENLELNRTTGALGNQIQVTSEGNSQVMRIQVEDANPENAAVIANELGTVFQQEIPQIMNVNNVSILSEATPDASPVSPNVELNSTIGLVIGLMISTGLAFLLAFLDTRIHTEEHVTKELGLPLLASVSHMDQKNVKKGRNLVSKKVKEGSRYGT
ncbi:YveK family protein [Salisediminibacterium beveridgei]|uniref:Capsular polysaccharide biosynthesis/export protein n=1 Tax=Salisediminibacterium beveridgei TaxID=632773 RepID=A0A1D7QRL1_9BACI|nr:Wzz/FepE/Etk N-terminal domain-containing protein [Salisediminibacterium beveridgei]AOM81644.1 capsular polysaccharide biosynthesis/export protein [Salisediminibacterium beveridgei]